MVKLEIKFQFDQMLTVGAVNRKQNIHKKFHRGINADLGGL